MTTFVKYRLGVTGDAHYLYKEVKSHEFISKDLDGWTAIFHRKESSVLGPDVRSGWFYLTEFNSRGIGQKSKLMTINLFIKMFITNYDLNNNGMTIPVLIVR